VEVVELAAYLHVEVVVVVVHDPSEALIDLVAQEYQVVG
jgi:hypothetical protein